MEPDIFNTERQSDRQTDRQTCSAGPTTNTTRLLPRYEGKTRGRHCSHWAPNDGGGGGVEETPETCWAVNKRQDNKLKKLLHQVGDLFEMYDDARTYKPLILHLNFSTPVCKMWIIQEPKKLKLWNKPHFEEKNGECAACSTLILLTWRKGWAPNNASKWQMGFNSAFKELKYSVRIFVEKNI